SRCCYDGRTPCIKAVSESPLAIDEVKGPGEDSTPSDGPSLTGRSVLRELEESLNLSADLKLRDVGAPEGAAPEFRPSSARYQILGTIGAGGMGTVFLAYDHDLKRRV